MWGLWWFVVMEGTHTNRAAASGPTCLAVPSVGRTDILSSGWCLLKSAELLGLWWKNWYFWVRWCSGMTLVVWNDSAPLQKKWMKWMKGIEALGGEVWKKKITDAFLDLFFSSEPLFWVFLTLSSLQGLVLVRRAPHPMDAEHQHSWEHGGGRAQGKLTISPNYL